MPIPNLTKQNIIDALAYIDEHGVPKQNESVTYDLITDNGKAYPAKYAVAVAVSLANGSEIDNEAFNSVQAVAFLKNLGFATVNKTLYTLTITADDVVSTDERFDLNDLGHGEIYKPLDAYFENANGEKVYRNRKKGEYKISNMALPRIAFQLYEKQIAALSDEEKLNFPICQYKPGAEVIRGIFGSLEEFKKSRNTIEYMIYTAADGSQFVIYCWNLFSTILFMRECLRRFGKEGDKLVLVYAEKSEQEKEQEQENPEIPTQPPTVADYKNPYSEKLLNSKNIILRGAPGTGKTYLAKQIAADIISGGEMQSFDELTAEQKKCAAFVQFHPSYDYSDFVEGLRPVIGDDGSMSFELRDGIFREFIAQARKNFEDSQKSAEETEREQTADELLKDFIEKTDFDETPFKTLKGHEFYITEVTDKSLFITNPKNKVAGKIVLSLDELRRILESEKVFSKPVEITEVLGQRWQKQAHSYYLALCKEIIKNKKKHPKKKVVSEKLRNYVFIIDEINRGEISKILGELFFSIDPGYRGKAGEVKTQYSNLRSHGDEGFYIPENVYIIGTMNDIDRSVDSFDFAMRRRFRFIEIKPDDCLGMLDNLGDMREEAIRRMTALNEEIVNTDDLNENYQIGAGYFRKLESMDFDELWTDCLEPLLRDYVRGMYGEDEIMQRFSAAYHNENA